MPQYDVIVVGLGVTGTRRALPAGAPRRARARHRAARARPRSRLVARRDPDHPARLFRASVLCAAAAPRLRAVARARGRDRRQLLHITGIAEIGPPDGDAGRAARSPPRGCTACRTRCWTRRRLMRRFPAFRLPADFVGVVQPDGGFVEAEAGDARHARAGARRTARRSGRRSRCAAVEPANGRRARRDQRRRRSKRGAVIVAAGPWTRSLLAGAGCRCASRGR